MTSSELPEKIKRGRAAAMEIIPALRQKLAEPDGKLHAATMLAAAAWLTGTSLYRSFHAEEDIPPGTIIQSDEINKEWESLIYLFETYSFGKADIPAGRLMLAAMAATDEHKPLKEMPDVQKALQVEFNQAMSRHGFDYAEASKAGVILCSILHHHFGTVTKEIDPLVAAGIITQGILESAKTAPPPLRPPD